MRRGGGSGGAGWPGAGWQGAGRWGAGWRRDAAWSSLEAAAAGAFSLVSALTVARLAGPAALGVAAGAVAVHVLLWVVCNALFADALVQVPATAPGAAASACVAGFAVGWVAAGVQAACGPPLAAALGDARLVPMAWVLALPLPLVGAAGAAQGVLMRARDYRRLARRTLAGQGTGTLAGLALAAWGAGAWALVVQQAVGAALGAVVLLVPARAALRGPVRWRAAAALLRLGLPLTAGTLAQAARYRVFAVLVGAAAGPAVLGQVHLAFRLVDTLRELANNALWRLLLPRLAAVQADRAALVAAVDRALAAYGAAAFPAFGAVALAAGPAVAAGLGPAWRPAACAAVPLAALAAQNLLGFAAQAALIARGRAGPALAYHAATTALVAGLAVLVAPATPLAAVGVWCAASLAAWPPLLRAAGRAAGTGGARLLRAGLAPLAGAAAACAGAWGVAALLAPHAGPVGLAAARLAAYAALLGLGAVAFRARGARRALPAARAVS